jgi:hypothetical protein
MSGWVRVGARCVCISDDWESSVVNPPLNLPVRGMVYVVRTVEVSTCDCGVGPWIRLEEIVNPVWDCKRCGCSGEDEFDAAYFRPVRNTSIDEFTRLLAPGPKMLENV